MSVPYKPEIITRRTDADLSAASWLIVAANGDNDMDVAGAASAGMIGILTANVVDATGLSPAEAYLDVQVGGFGKVEFGGAVTAGRPVTANASGQAVLANAGERAIGIAWETAANGDIGAIIISHFTA